MDCFPYPPLFDVPFQRNPSVFVDVTCPAKARGMGYSRVKIALSKLQPFLTDPSVWQTDGWTDGRAIACSPLCCLARIITDYRLSETRSIFADEMYLTICRPTCTIQFYSVKQTDKVWFVWIRWKLLWFQTLSSRLGTESPSSQVKSSSL